MQDASPTPLPHSWRELIYIAITALLTLGASFLPRLFRPKQSKAEEAKIAAETRLIDLNAAILGTDQMTKLAHKLAVADANIERLRSQKEWWRTKFDRELTRADAEQARADLLELELQRLRRGK